MLTQELVVKSLRDKVKSDKVANDVCLVLSQRQRARGQITLRALQKKMEKEGFHYDKQDYVSFLKFLSQLEIGTLEHLSGKVTALKGIRIRLQQLGLAAMGEVGYIKGWKPRNKFINITRPDAIKTSPLTPVRKPVPKNDAPLVATKVVVGIMVNGKLVQIELPKGITTQETAAILSRLQGDETERRQEASA